MLYYFFSVPQFDKITFFNQIFWFLLVFFAFYFLILKSLLPVLAASLKTRKKIVHSILFASNSLLDNSSKKSYVKNLQKVLKTHKTLFGNLSQKKLSLSGQTKAKVLEKSLFIS